MPGWTNGREALILAPVLWGALLLNDLLVTPEAWLLLLPASLVGMTLASLLAVVLRRVFDFTLGLAVLWSAIAVAISAAVQSGLDLLLRRSSCPTDRAYPAMPCRTVPSSLSCTFASCCRGIWWSSVSMARHWPC